MPEWKSFTFGDDGEAKASPLPAPAAPSPAMEADEYAAKWGTEVSELTIERIEKVLEGDGLPHGSNEFIAVTNTTAAKPIQTTLLSGNPKKFANK